MHDKESQIRTAMEREGGEKGERRRGKRGGGRERRGERERETVHLSVSTKKAEKSTAEMHVIEE